jgi:uncharacterized protein with HEPN domain
VRRRDVRVHLFDILTAAEAVGSFVVGRTLEDYRRNLMLRSAVERQLEILGEAMARALKVEPGLGLLVPDARRIIDFRNVVAHGYDVLDDARVWDVAVRLAPRLQDCVRRVLEARAAPD